MEEPMVLLLALLASFSMITGCSSSEQAAQETELTVEVAVAENLVHCQGQRYSGKIRGPTKPR